MFKFAAPAAALLGLALTAAPALAAEKTQVKVVYSDLDLTSSEGQRTLERRLESAARKACGFTRTRTGSLKANTFSRTCYKQARVKANDAMASAIDNASGTRLGG